jgi:hypothetical protein
MDSFLSLMVGIRHLKLDVVMKLQSRWRMCKPLYHHQARTLITVTYDNGVTIRHVEKARRLTLPLCCTRHQRKYLNMWCTYVNQWNVIEVVGTSFAQSQINHT